MRAWLSAAMEQATRDAIATEPDVVPIVVIAHPSPGVGTRRYAVLELEQLARPLGMEQRPETTP